VLAGKLAAAFAPLASHAQVRHLRQQGMILAFDVQEPDAARRASFARRMFAACMERGLLLRPIGTTVYAMPPYVLNDAEVAHLGEGMRAALDITLGSA
jgi:adenosylmethionine-8-amino-7-oxononanoate aminotransferase